MTADTIFSIANLAALTGWLVLAAGVVLKKPLLRDGLAGRWWPLGFSVVYSALIIFFFFQAPGGFDTLANVKLLFTSDWAALAGWIHYLAFDLFMGAFVARRVMELGLTRLVLIVLLPLTFMFGPAGFLGFEICRLLFSRSTSSEGHTS